jgi:hypothetical protein
MTPKEKASELLEKFSSLCWECDDQKTFALISVDEIINETLELDRLRYWKEVKNEIKKTN